MNLRQATRDSIDRAIAAFEDATHARSGVRARVGRARRRVRAQGQLPQHPRDGASRRSRLERRALAIDPELADAHMWLGTRACCASGAPTKRSPRFRKRSGSIPNNGQAYQALARALLGRQGRLQGGDSAVRTCDRAQSGSRLLLPAAVAAARLGRAARSRGGDLPPRGGAPGAVHLGQPGSADRRRARAGSATSTTCKAQYDEALREYERELAFIGAGDHALRERTQLELNVKIGAAYLRQGRTRGCRAAFRSRAEELRRAGRAAAPTIRSRATTSRASTRCAASTTGRSIRSSASRQSTRS